MTLYAGSQQSVVAPNIAYPGERRGLPLYNDEQGVLGATDFQIGTFVWAVSGTNTVGQIKGANTRIAGFAVRNNANIYPNANILQGWNLTIQAGYQGQIVSGNGTFYCAVTSLNGGGTINNGDGVYTTDATGIVVVSTSNPGVGYTAVGYSVINNSVANSFGVNLVVISNYETF